MASELPEKKAIAGFQFAIDRGGTFTDVYCRCPSGKEVVMKLLSVDPLNYPDAPMEGIRRILEQVGEVVCSLGRRGRGLLPVAYSYLIWCVPETLISQPYTQTLIINLKGEVQ